MADHAALEMPAHGHSHPISWYNRKRVQLLLLAGLTAILVIVLAGPRPRVQNDVPGGNEDGGPRRQTAAHGDTVDGHHHQHKGDLVQVDFYGESLCPDCQHMVRDVLAPLFKNGVADLMRLRYHAFGNVKNNTAGSFAYQHGPTEGKYNRYILCAQHFHGQQSEWFPYAHCFADNMRALDAKADSCAIDQGWDAAEIASCANGDQGKELEQEAAKATWGLPLHNTFVPWMVINDAPIGNDFERLERYVCAAAPLDGRPPPCFDLPESMKHQ